MLNRLLVCVRWSMRSPKSANSSDLGFSDKHIDRQCIVPQGDRENRKESDQIRPDSRLMLQIIRAQKLLPSSVLTGWPAVCYSRVRSVRECRYSNQSDLTLVGERIECATDSISTCWQRPPKTRKCSRPALLTTENGLSSFDFCRLFSFQAGAASSWINGRYRIFHVAPRYVSFFKNKQAATQSRRTGRRGVRAWQAFNFVCRLLERIPQRWSCSEPDATTSTGEVLFSFCGLGCRVRWMWEVGPVLVAWAWVDQRYMSRLVYAAAFSRFDVENDVFGFSFSSHWNFTARDT